MRIESGQRQQALLQLLLKHKDGLTREALAKLLGISKAAVHQHLMVLERGGYVTQCELRKTRGRPSQVYALTERGVHLFPKHYAWFSRLLLEQLIARLGSTQVQELLYRLGRDAAAALRARLEGKAAGERLQEVVKIMQEFGYEAELEGKEIAAINCVYHDLAKDHPEVCAFDLGLLDELTDTPVAQTECMLRGGMACRFCHLPMAQDQDTA